MSVHVTATDMATGEKLGSWTTLESGEHIPYPKTSGRPNKVYVASSWKNHLHTAVVAALRAANIDCYDFKFDEGAGFHWSDTGLDRGPDGINTDVCTFDEYKKALTHPRAEEGFASDINAMEACDACILVLPCGKSAHLELGWFVGKGRRTAIISFEETIQPELMYKMVDFVTNSLYDLLGWLGVED